MLISRNIDAALTGARFEASFGFIQCWTDCCVCAFISVCLFVLLSVSCWCACVLTYLLFLSVYLCVSLMFLYVYLSPSLYLSMYACVLPGRLFLNTFRRRHKDSSQFLRCRPIRRNIYNHFPNNDRVADSVGPQFGRRLSTRGSLKLQRRLSTPPCMNTVRLNRTYNPVVKSTARFVTARRLIYYLAGARSCLPGHVSYLSERTQRSISIITLLCIDR